MARRLVTLGLALLLVACSRPRPSPEYDRARTLWGEIVRARPAAPADDPRSDEVLRLLDAVPRDSADAADASALRDRIARERAEGAAERARREELARRAGPAEALPAPSAAPGNGGPTRAGGAPQQPALPPLATGMKLDDFRAAYGSCFAPGGAVQITSTERSPRAGEMWVMKDDPRCREAHPSLVGQTVLFADGTIAGVSPVSAMKRIEVRREVQLAPLPDGSTGMVVDGAVVPLPPGTTVAPPAGAAR